MYNMNDNTKLIGLVSLFVVALTTAQVVSSKLLYVSLPVLGAVAMPGGTLAYAITFFSTDVTGELYGKDTARKVVNIGFLMNLVLLALIWATITWPAAGNSLDPQMFETVLGGSTNIIAGSLGAFLISQNWDVSVFHSVREKTDGKALWLRNVVSTGTSQAIDTVIFTLVAFAIVPSISGIGTSLPLSVIGSLIVGQYTAKLVLALVDTPFVYLATK